MGSLVYRGKNRIRDWHQLVTEEVRELFIAVSPPVAVSGGIIWNVSIQVFQNLHKMTKSGKTFQLTIAKGNTFLPD